jgi:hypothetical protein
MSVNHAKMEVSALQEASSLLDVRKGHIQLLKRRKKLGLVQ